MHDVSSTELRNLCAEDSSDSKDRALLKEWLKWWLTDNDAPPKLPLSLHLRTALHLSIEKEPT